MNASTTDAAVLEQLKAIRSELKTMRELMEEDRLEVIRCGCGCTELEAEQDKEDSRFTKFKCKRCGAVFRIEGGVAEFEVKRRQKP